MQSAAAASRQRNVHPFALDVRRVTTGIYEAVRRGDVQRGMELQERFLDFVQFGWDYGMAAVWELVMHQRVLAEVLPPRIEAIDKALDEV